MRADASPGSTVDLRRRSTIPSTEESEMPKTLMSWILASLLLVGSLPTLAMAAEEGPTVDEQMAGLEAHCAATAEARAGRHAETPLYERLGGYDRNHELTREIVRLHEINATIVHTLEGVDTENLAKLVADFIAAGTGGDMQYAGRDLPSSHAHLKLTDADFLSAGSDVALAMKNLEYGQEEIDEMLCILVSLKSQVVFE
jgi:hemoglobin